MNGRLGISISRAEGMSTTPSLICKGNEDATFLSEWEKRVEKDKLYLYAIKLFNMPLECKATVSSIDENNKFVMLLFSFTDGNVFSFENYVPNGFTSTLKAPKGFPDEKDAQSVLEAYSRYMGAKIDWTRPERSTEEGNQVEIFGDSRSGINKSAVMVYKNNRLVEIEFGVAP
jgi:hypothetical protein